MKVILAVSFLLCIASICHGQSDYRQGYLINHANDTVHGLLDYRQGTESYRSCDFKQTKRAHSVTYKPEDITGYGFLNDKYFESRVIDSTTSKPVFLEVVVRGGAASLYRYERMYFVEKKEKGLHALTNESKFTYVNELKVNRKSNAYIATLNMLFFDCVESRDRLRRILLRERSLTDVVEAYNRCASEFSVTFKASKPWVKLAPTIGGGISVPVVGVADRWSSGGEAVSTVHATSSPVAGLLVDISSPRLNESLAFHTGIFYKKNRYYGYSLSVEPHLTVREYATLDLQSLEIPLGLRYTFPKRKLTPFLDAGISYSRRVGLRSDLMQEREQMGLVSTLYRDDLTFVKSQVGSWIGAGSTVRLPFLFDGILQFRVGRSSTIALVNAVTRITTYQVIVGIKTK